MPTYEECMEGACSCDWCVAARDMRAPDPIKPVVAPSMMDEQISDIVRYGGAEAARKADRLEADAAAIREEFADVLADANLSRIAATEVYSLRLRVTKREISMSEMDIFRAAGQHARGTRATASALPAKALGGDRQRIGLFVP